MNIQNGLVTMSDDMLQEVNGGDISYDLGYAAGTAARTLELFVVTSVAIVSSIGDYLSH
jgi:hypothetical protein